LLRSPPLKIFFSNIILIPRPFLSVIFLRQISSHQFCSYITCQLHNLFRVCLASASCPQTFCNCALCFQFAGLKPLQIILQLSSRVQSFLRSKKLCPSPGNTKQSARYFLRVLYCVAGQSLAFYFIQLTDCRAAIQKVQPQPLQSGIWGNRMRFPAPTYP